MMHPAGASVGIWRACMGILRVSGRGDPGRACVRADPESACVGIHRARTQACGNPAGTDTRVRGSSGSQTSNSVHHIVDLFLSDCIMTSCI